MRNLDLDWTEFLDALPVYKRLSVQAREAFIVNGSQTYAVAAEITARSTLDELVQNGMYATTAGGRHVALVPRYHAFVKAMRAMHRSRIDTAANAEAFDRYVADNFTRDEWSSFYGGGYWAQSRQGLYSKMTAVTWVEKFEPFPRDPPDESAMLKKLVKHLMDTPEAVAFEELYELCSDRALLARSIRMGIRYVLFYPMLRRKTLDPVLGLWPKISQRLHRQAAKPPQPVMPVHTFCAPILIDEMAAVLTACIAEPLRILAGSGGALYAKSEKQVAARLMHIPEWLPELLRKPDGERIRQAVGMLQELKMIEQEDKQGSDYRFEVTQIGRAWLGMPAKVRLKGLLDRVRNFKRQQRGWYDRQWEELAHPIYVGGDAINTHKPVGEAFARIPAGQALRLEDFVTYESRVHNPLAVEREPRFRVTIGYTHIEEPTYEDLEQHWAAVLKQAFEYKLVPFGAVEVGSTKDGKLTVALSEVGRYLLGLADDFSLQRADVAGAIVVQPNFDIVFMAPSTLAEAELSSFTERHGKHVGAVLKITRQSVWAAAAAGITADNVLRALQTHSSVPIPANVEREIRGWMGRCRRASIRPAMLIHCPDAETASRVLAVERTRLTRLSDTVLELNDPSYRTKLVKRLREIGVFV